MDCVIRQATSEDCDHLMGLIREIGDFHQNLAEITINTQVLRADGFGAKPFFQCILAEPPVEEGRTPVRPIGYALYFFGYTFNHGRMVYLENLYVVPEFRGKGIGVKLLAKVAEIALAAGCVSMKFDSVEWNHLAMDFYLHLGAHNLTESEKRNSMELGEEALQRLAQRARHSRGDV